MTQPVLKVFLKDGAKLPAYAHAGDSGLDLCSTAAVKLKPFQRVFIDTGVHIELPAGHEATVRPRSGGNKRGLHIAQGTIDGPYRGPVGVVVYWMAELHVNPFDLSVHLATGPAEYQIELGERFAQLVVSQVANCDVQQVASLEELSETERGERGFGSSGR